MTQLTAHFSLEEFIISNTADRLKIDNTIPDELLANVARTAELMEKVRDLLGAKPILVTSGYRSPALNAAVGGVPGKSSHMAALACDFICPSFGTPLDVCNRLKTAIGALKFDQLIYEYSWIHIGLSMQGVSPRLQLLTLMPNGTYQFGIVPR